MTTFQLDELHVEVVRKNIKNVYLSVYPPDGKVKVSAPLYTDLETIRGFVVSRLSWIMRQQEKLKNQQREARKDFDEPESRYYRGKRYRLRVIEADEKPKVELSHKYLTLYVRPGHDSAKRQAILNEWYRRQLKQEIPQLISRYEKRMNVNVAEFGVKRMKTKWGTCNPGARRIWINLELAKKSPECLEYIVVHEMMHLLERIHNNRFVSLMDLFLPEWRFCENELNGGI